MSEEFEKFPANMADVVVPEEPEEVEVNVKNEKIVESEKPTKRSKIEEKAPQKQAANEALSGDRKLCWSGLIDNGEQIKFEVNAFHLYGSRKAVTLLSNPLEIVGRSDLRQLQPFFKHLKNSSSRTMFVVYLNPMNASCETQYWQFCEFLSAKSRAAVLFKTELSEAYLIPPGPVAATLHEKGKDRLLGVIVLKKEYERNLPEVNSLSSMPAQHAAIPGTIKNVNSEYQPEDSVAQTETPNAPASATAFGGIDTSIYTMPSGATAAAATAPTTGFDAAAYARFLSAQISSSSNPSQNTFMNTSAFPNYALGNNFSSASYAPPATFQHMMYTQFNPQNNTRSDPPPPPLPPQNNVQNPLNGFNFNIYGQFPKNWNS
uniref:Spen paralogue and orthologue SPOC C-terminal domain-containing protein n=1 Tax=Timspurckia oligopyrenoides TaxID=708627 RepID=A0A7S0ZIR4_9RHOD|mmetsp:Transcript_6895/g.12344  ORF Transcript_6895/g.12344 Transcript_6895/m.12344 type:complete len:375 (+) Transcript_6895:1022-2146(+)